MQLLPAQTLAADDPLDYDLRVEGLGWHAVALGKGRGSIATLHKPRPRRQTDFRLALDAPALAELLAAGGSREVRRAGRARVRGTLRRRRALRRLPAAPLDLADLAEAGVWPDPGLVYRTLAARRPRLDGGHPLVVALEVDGPRGGRWAVDAPGGEPLVVTPGRAEQPSATVLILRPPSRGSWPDAPEPPRARRPFAATWRRWPGSWDGSSGRSATRTERVRRVRESSATPRCRPHGRLCWDAP